MRTVRSTKEPYRERGKRTRIPEDISVVGFDDLAACDWVTPPLTTVQQRLVDMARMAVQVIIEGAGEARRIELATSLTVRESTAPPRPL